MTFHCHSHHLLHSLRVAAKLEGPTIGIDLGTTYSCVAAYRNGRIEIIANDQGNRITPSIVAWTAAGERLIGDAAKNQASNNPTNTVFDAKRIIGRRYDDPSVASDAKTFPFGIVKNNDMPFIQVETTEGTKKTFAPEEISAMVLTRMKETAERYLGETVTNAVVTVPAYFNDAQRQATMDAGRIAGLNVIRMINEPTAAALAYGLDKAADDLKILVFDLGGGTFDVSILTIDHGVFEVMSTNGDTHLGGQDFDLRVMNWVMQRVKEKHGKDLTGNKQAIARIRRESERAKRVLSSEHSTKIEVEGIIDGEDFTETLTRAKFEELNRDLFERCLPPVQASLDDAKLKKSDIAEIVLVGGSTRIPYVQSMLSKFFDGKELSFKVNPDEAVAHGAAVQASIVAGHAFKDVLLIDVTPLTIGLELSGGEFMRFIERNTQVPVSKTRYVTTEDDYQTSIPIRVFQGERANVKDNILLGEFDLEGLPPLKRGVPEVEVTFSMDANSILQVTAVDKATKKSGTITITADKNRLSEAQIRRMTLDAKRNAEKDRAWKATIDSKNELEQYLYSVRNIIEDKGKVADRLTQAEVDKVTAKITEGLAFVDSHSEERDANDYTLKRKEYEDYCTPYMTKLYTGKAGGGRPNHDEL